MKEGNPMCFTNISAEFYIMLCYSTDYENIVSVVMDDDIYLETPCEMINI